MSFQSKENNYDSCTCESDGETKNAHTILKGKHFGKQPLGRPRKRWENTI
jgi:hypothetical protein